MSQALIDFLTFLVWNVDGNRFKRKESGSSIDLGHLKAVMHTLYKEDKADDVGTSRKRQSSETKNIKIQAKRQRVEVDSNKKCRSYGSISHKSKRSPDCSQHILSKLEVLTENLGTGFQTFTRKLPLDTCVNDRYRSVLKNRILSAIKLASGNTQCLTEAYVEVSVAYLNVIVETFEKRVLYYLYFLIQNMLLTR
ncbi:uncharacterized protein BX663DRAFT_574492 [Cokeromyces recurvatus]|uniref:uncharacterized protein n=1 Tax=Cokeromyces recurvatus TaxID=90255 RepID=UPI002220862C|nr:uncharacterized protein BX663DRAFT_574492 [Cokeromyces recurvatus]KAI7900538.1 hypothetical protein BX663DRAFT_574492 [Cokeromyces recurvatus]